MRRLLPLALLVVWGCAGPSEVPSRAPASVGLSLEKLKKVDPVLKEFVAKKQIAGGLILVAKDGAQVYETSCGSMDVEAAKPMRSDAIFRIYSMSKAIVTAGALVLVDDGRIGLDDPVSKYVPEVKDQKVMTPEGPRAPSRPATVKDLMLHCAGYTYGGGDRPNVDKFYKDLKPLE